MAVFCVDEHEFWFFFIVGNLTTGWKTVKDRISVLFLFFFLMNVTQEAPRYTCFMKNAPLPKWIPQPLTSFKPALRPWDLEIYVFGRLKWVDVPLGIVPYVKRMFQIGRLLQVLAKIARRRWDIWAISYSDFCSQRS